MATRAATFTAKIRNLKDYHYRMINSVTPMPSGVDVANTLKYFSQTLLSVLKDVPFIPSETYGPRQRDSVRLSMFPSLNYSGLYEAVMNIIDVVPLVQNGQQSLGESILTLLGCLVPFLESDLLDTLPYTVASTLAIFPLGLQKESIELLCTNLLPVTLGYEGVNENPTYATESTSAILMMVFQYVEAGEYHSQVLECLMGMKKNLIKDLLSVIAFGPPTAKPPAVNHLFYYWPQLNPALTDRRGIHYKYTAWQPTTCMRENCPNSGNVKAVKMCLDPTIAIDCAEKPPPLYVCADCVDQLRREHAQTLVDILQPMHEVAIKCENKNCTAPKNEAVSTCFSIECASLNGFKPMRYCMACHRLKHHEECAENHIYHESLCDIWTSDPDVQNYLVEAVVSLLKEAQPLEEKRTVEMGEERLRHQQHFEEDDDSEGEEGDERKLLSRYGIWLMVELCRSKDEVSIEILGRLLAMLFQWFDATAYLPDDNVGNALERLKPEYIYKWLQEVNRTHFEVIVSCLLPHPPEYARVGGYWDTLASRTSQIKEGLNRLFCLVPYDIVTFEVWDYVMPFWLEAIRTEVPEEERQELKVLLCKTFDIDMSPLPFTIDKVYHFFMERFENTTSSVQEQNLAWLQILTSLEILVPPQLLLGMFKTGVAALKNPPGVEASTHPPPQERQPVCTQNVFLDEFPPLSPLTPPADQNPQFAFDVPEEEKIPNTTCMIMMLDVILRQVELQDVPAHQGFSFDVCQDIMLLMTDMLAVKWDGAHSCTHQDEVTECTMCEVCALFHQLAASVMEFVAPKNELKLPEKDLPKVDEIQHKIVEEAQERKEAEANGEQPEPEEPDPVFDAEDLPVHLRLLYALLKDLDEQSDADALFFLIKIIKLLCLHAECLTCTFLEHEQFIRFCLRKLMIPNMWKLMQAEHSQIATMCVPVLLHCLTLPPGSEVFWKIIENDFNHEDWRARYSAVEKVAILARLINPDSIQSNQQIKTALAHAFCYMIGSLNDISSAVVQRTTLYLETIQESAIQCVCTCLEFQFDSVISDRTMILCKVALLATTLKEMSIFTWEFFLNRFDTLCLEAQLDLETNGDISSLQDLHSSDRHSDHFLRKINRARFALARTDSIRSVSGSLYGKVPYRRAASVPMHLLTRTLPNQQSAKATVLAPIPESNMNARVHDINQLKPFLEVLAQHHTEKDKSPYTRQQSAPQFRSRGSRFGLGVFSNYMFPGGHLREFTDEESNFAALLQRAMDLEGVDRETLHHLVKLLMKFMIHSDQDGVNDNSNNSKVQNIVLRHLNVLLGYNQTEKAFSVPPYKLRYSAVFNAYMSGLAQVLDKNFPLGNIILPVSMLLLQYCPSPQRYASDYQPPNYTLWYLEPHTRQSWLMALLVILYKYQYNTSPASGTIQTLVRITINTIDAQLHRCRRNDDTFMPHSPMVPRTRDTSNVSVGDLEKIYETDTPPQSPTDSQPSIGDTVTISMASPTATSVHYKRRAESEKTEETDIESLSPTSKVATPSPKVVSPIGRPQSPPLPTSPTTSMPSSPSLPLKSPPARTRGMFRGGEPKTPPGLSSPTETLAAMQKDQTRRIAEYQHGPMVDGIGSHVSAQRPGPPPMLKQKTEPALKYKPFQQRTLEESAEEYMLEQAGVPPRPHAERPDFFVKGITDPAHSPPDVDKKIAQQIQEFESQSEAKKNASHTIEVKPLAHWDKPYGLGIERFETVLEDLKESEEEWESPKRGGPRGAMVRATSTQLAEATDKRPDTDPDPEFIGVKVQRERALSEKDGGDLEERDTMQTESELDESPCPSPGPQPRIKPQFRQRKQRKTGLTTVELQKMIPELSDLSNDRRSPTPSRKSRRTELLTKVQQVSQKRSMSAMRATEQVVVDRCPECNAVLELYDEDTVSLGITCLATFIHREPSLAAPMLLDMLQCVARIASSNPYPWQVEISGLIIPGNSVSVARQFLRCVLHQLAPNGIFPQLFMTELDDCDFLKTVASSLVDFSELTCYSALQLLLEGINEMKNLSSEQMNNVVINLATYMDYITLETSSPTWSNILLQFDVFFRRLPSLLTSPCDMGPVLKIIIAVLKIPGLASVKGILDPFSKLLSFTIQHCTFKLQHLLDICSLCSRAFSKDRDKLYLARCIIFEMIQALKFKSTLPDENLLLLVQFVCMDAGGTLGPTNIVEELAQFCYNPYSQNLISTNAAECMKQHLNECVEFIADLHTISKVKGNMKGSAQTQASLNEDTLGSVLKAGIAQYVALEFTRANGRDNRAIGRYLPWLYHPPSTVQQGPREFTECVGHIRLLSWLLLGSLTHTAITKASSSVVCQPLPLESSSFIADHIMVIMTGFAEQSKASVLHMSSLFHAFILCQLWTMYCESFGAVNNPTAEGYSMAHSTIMDFWARVTPGVLQLLSHSKVLAEMVNLHFLSLMEALQECNSMILSKLFPMWIPILFSYHNKLPGHMQVRLQMCQNWEPRDTKDTHQLDSDMLLEWLKRLQFKLGQIEVQSSQAQQFYTV